MKNVVLCTLNYYEQRGQCVSPCRFISSEVTLPRRSMESCVGLFILSEAGLLGMSMCCYHYEAHFAHNKNCAIPCVCDFASPMLCIAIMDTQCTIVMDSRNCAIHNRAIQNRACRTSLTKYCSIYFPSYWHALVCA